MSWRWFLPLVAALAVLVGSVTTYAAAGLVGESSCCCPQPDHCKCHDHDGAPVPDDLMKKCGGDAERVAPNVQVATVPTPPSVDISSVIVDPPPSIDPPPEAWVVELETPPF